jgi:hypothetical protein
LVAANKNPDATANSLRATDAARGVLITVIIGVVGYFAVMPSPQPAQGGFWITHNGLTMLLIAIALQLAIIFGRPLLARIERAQGMDGQISPMVIHVLQLLADGATVLLFALAVFGGLSAFNDSI